MHEPLMRQRPTPPSSQRPVAPGGLLQHQAAVANAQPSGALPRQTTRPNTLNSTPHDAPNNTTIMSVDPFDSALYVVPDCPAGAPQADPTSSVTSSAGSTPSTQPSTSPTSSPSRPT